MVFGLLNFNKYNKKADTKWYPPKPTYELESTHCTRPNNPYVNIISQNNYDTIPKHTYAGLESLTCAGRR